MATVSSHTLCKSCQNFNIQAFSRDSYAHRGYSVASFIRSAKAGCAFCSMLLEQFRIADAGSKVKFLEIELRKVSGERAHVKWLSREGQTLFYWWALTMLVPVWVNFRVQRRRYLPSRGTEALNIVELTAFVSPYSTWNHLETGFTHSIKVHLAADAGTPAAVSQDIVGRIATEEYTWSWSHAKAIATWHRECKKKHEECGQTLSRKESFDVDAVPLPSRCVEVVYNDTNANPSLPLHSYYIRETVGMRGKYIALSHRWGGCTFASRTLRRNYKCRVGRCDPRTCTEPWIPPTQLFCDAALLASNLGVRYIWIDSWCIVQDDDEDWARESVRMADYYQYAWLTISATTLTPAGGFFGMLSPEKAPTITRLPYYDKQGGQQGHFYAQCVGEDKLAHDYVQHVSRSSLLRRGWVYQEWMLSRRLLAFSAAGIFVQCQKHAPKGLAGDTVKRWAALDDDAAAAEPAGFRDLAFKGALDLKMSTRDEVWTSWLTAVETYSKLEVTKLEEDRLIALGGVAKEFGIALSELDKERENKVEVVSQKGKERERLLAKCMHQYVSGLWFGCVIGLLWEQVHSGPRRRVQGLPTWSWASIATLMHNEKGEEVLTGMAVQWSLTPNRRRKWEVACEMAQARTVPVAVSADGDGHTIMTPLYHQATINPPENEFSKEHRFVMLGMKGRLVSVQVHGEFESEDDCETAAVLTNHSPNFGRHMWRRVTTESLPDFVIGWASIEHPDWQGANNDDAAHRDDLSPSQSIGQGQAVHAFVVSRLGKVKGGFGYGNWTGYHAVYHVVFLNPVNIPGFGTCYQRLGTGRLFGNDIDSALQETQATEDLVWLI